MLGHKGVMKMKLIKACSVVLFAFALTACSTEINSGQSSGSLHETSEYFSGNTQKTPDRQYLTSDRISSYSLYAVEGMTIDLPEIGLYDMIVRKRAEGYVSDISEQPLSVYIIGDYRYGRNAWHDAFLVVETGKEVLFYDFDNTSLDEYLYLCDIDGDGLDEIIIHQRIDAFGTPGQFSSLVFKVVYDEIQVLFDFRSFDSEGNYVDYYDTGYISALINGFKVEIHNLFTSYSVILDFSASLVKLDRYFDEKGNVLEQLETIGSSSFYKFIPVDIDGDGVYEIECYQVVRSFFPGGSIGYTKSILRYNPHLRLFEVARAEFFPYDNLNITIIQPD